MYCLRRQKRACAGCWMEFNCSLHLLRCVSEGGLWDGVLDIHPTLWCWQRMGVTHTGSEPERPVWVQITAYLTPDSVWLLVDCPLASAHWLWHWHADSVGLMGNPSTKTRTKHWKTCAGYPRVHLITIVSFTLTATWQWERLGYWWWNHCSEKWSDVPKASQLARVRLKKLCSDLGVWLQCWGHVISWMWHRKCSARSQAPRRYTPPWDSELGSF